MENAAVLAAGQTITLPLAASQGGTALSTAPANGDFLVGNASSGFDLKNATQARIALGVVSATDSIASTLLDARGDLIVASAADTAAKLSVGSNGTMLRATSGATTGMEWGAPAGYIWGLTISNNVASAASVADISLGEAASSSTTHSSRAILSLTSGFVKRLDTTWAAGSGNGGRTSSQAIANGTWHVCLIRVAGVDDVGFDTSATCANLITDHSATHVRRIGSLLRESGSIVSFVQDGDLFQRKTPILDVATNSIGTSAVTRTLSVPTGVNVLARFNSVSTQDSAPVSFYFSDLAVNDDAPSLTVAPLSSEGRGSIASAFDFASSHQVRTNTSAQIRTRGSASSAVIYLRIATTGWIDTRGRLN